MKHTKLLASLSTLLTAGLLLAFTPAKATNYPGNGNTGFGGPVGNGVLSVTDDGTNITFNFQRGSSGNLNDVLSIYIDTGAGGYADTSSFTDTGGTEQKGISGYDGTSRSVMTFTNGFRPGYAIAIKSDFMDLWNLSNPAGFSFLAGVGGYSSSSANFILTFPAADIGLAANITTNIRIFGTLLNPYGAYRSTEAIAGNDVASAFGQGPYPFTNTAFTTYTFAAPPAPTNPVTFSVDMSAQLINETFNPGNGDTVYVGGSFESTPFAFSLQLTNDPASANPNIYSGTYPDQNPTNTPEQYKFKFYSVANSADTYDADPNRIFNLQSGGQVVPLVYFNNQPASPSATTNYITFQIDMGPQIYLGHFDPGAGDQVKVSGGFQTPQFSADLTLTNDPAGANTNIYSGAFADHNYPGTQYLSPQNGYKYVIVTSSSTNYESGANRSLVTPTNSVTLPVAYFNGINTYSAIPITFSVDMTVPVLTGQFNPGNGDTVGCAGTFQTNAFTVGAGGFLLTNNPAAANTNVYSGTYIDRNAPGVVEQYKFVINTNGGSTAFESPASTGGNDRVFLLGDVAATNPLVFWNDSDPNQVLLAPVTITFTVNMTNATDVYGFPFDPVNDYVVINGDFVTPAWNSYSGGTPPDFWTDPNFYYPDLFVSDYGPGNPYGPSFILTSAGSGLIYSGTFTVPAGHPLQINYKYGIYHDAGNFLTNCDNEAAFGLNHSRYIRATGSYTFPVDIFGIQRTNQAAATEPAFGNLVINAPVAGSLPISWLGLPGVCLQTTTNLSNPVWETQNATAGSSSTNWPISGPARFFRLVQP